MNIQEVANQIPPGKYLLAISGGVDSMTLLELVAKADFGRGYSFVVAHVNHGIRPASEANADEQLVRAISFFYGFDFECTRLNLGPDASEAKARDARMSFFDKVISKHKLDKIITAHHKDDVIETMMINLIRGTGRSGLSSLKNDDRFLRPLINIEKNEIIDFAKRSDVEFLEDSTNTDESILRNYVRANVMPKIGSKKEDFFQIYRDMLELNSEIDKQLTDLAGSLEQSELEFRRNDLIMLPIEVSLSLLHFICVNKLGLETNSNMLLSLRNFIHAAAAGKIYDLNKKWNVIAGKSTIKFAEA